MCETNYMATTSTIGGQSLLPGKIHAPGFIASLELCVSLNLALAKLLVMMMCCMAPGLQSYGYHVHA
jgi:hypothetical protein